MDYENDFIRIIHNAITVFACHKAGKIHQTVKKISCCYENCNLLTLINLSIIDIVKDNASKFWY